jgi:glycine oxidase
MPLPAWDYNSTPSADQKVKALPSSSTSADVIVVGAGVIGLMTARMLAQHGFDVLVLDRGKAGREASWAGGGILAPLRPWDYPEPVWALCDRSRRLYPQLSLALRAESGVDPQCLNSGAVLVGAGSDERQRALDWHAAQQLDCALNEVGNLEMPWVHQVRNPRLCRALVAGLRRVGIRVIEHCPAVSTLRQDGRVIGVSTPLGPFMAPQVVIAAGAWSAGLSVTPLPVKPVRGQMLLLQSRHEMKPAIYLLPRSYVIVRADGAVLTGSTMEDAGYSKSVTVGARVMLAAEAVRYLPELDGCGIVRQWSGLRPGSPDGIPFIGPDPALQGLWRNTGHHRNGLAMAPASAERLVSMMLEAPLTHQLTSA